MNNQGQFEKVLLAAGMLANENVTFFGTTLKKKIQDGEYDLRPSEIVVKKFINEASSDFDLVDGNDRTEGIVDFYSGNQLKNDAFAITAIRIDYGVCANDNNDLGKVVFGGVNVDPANEAKLSLQTKDGALTVYERAVTHITKGIPSDTHKTSDPGEHQDKVVFLADNSEQGMRLKFPKGAAVPAVDAANSKRAIAVRLYGYAIVGR